ncbi:MAG TPA: serine hydrolase domain-containing protein [Longimicrobiaceae bacterium]|nr:serine hydrolase domain-containing protein [Longimicrobiaceae bacterium]
MNRSRLRLALALLALLPTTVIAQQPTPLTVDVPVERALESDGAHTYVISLPDDQWIIGQVEQESVDVVVTVTGPMGTSIAGFDGPNRGPEYFEFTAEDAGEYRIEVASADEEGGSYAILLESVEAVAGEPAARIDQLFGRYERADLPGVIIGVMRDGELAFARGYGMANLAYDIEMTPLTVSNIGSVSKQFTAFAIALLADRGELSLDDDIREHLPELPEFAFPITIRNLLNHTSGLREVYNTLPIAGWRFEDELLREDVFEIVERQPELQFRPGSKHVYNNTGYILLAEIVERTTGEPFDVWMKANVFDPLGMSSTRVKMRRGEIIPNSTFGYTLATEDEAARFRRVGDLAASYGAGGIYTTPADLGRWMANFRTADVGGRAVVDRMTEQTILLSGDTLEYALGIVVDEYRGLDRLQHGGADIAHRAQLNYYPDLNAGVVVMSNLATFGAAGAANRVAEAFFGEQMAPEEEPPTAVAGTSEVEVDQDLLESYAGTYRLEGPGIMVEFMAEGGKLMSQMAGQPPVEFVALSDSSFALAAAQARVVFHAGAENRVETATLYQGREHTLRRVDGWTPTPADLAEFAGRYYSAELQTFYTLAVEEGGLVIHHSRLTDVKLTPAEEDSFGSDSVFLAEVDFERGPDGEVTGFRVSNSRTTGILFELMEQ